MARCSSENHFTWVHLLVHVERYIYIFSPRQFIFSRKESFNFLHGKNSLATSLRETKRGIGGPPMIHMQTSFQSHVSFCPLLYLMSLSPKLPPFFSSENKAASSCLRWAGLYKSAIMGVLYNPM